MAKEIKKEKKKKPLYYNPPNILREKCGVGGIDPKILEEAEKYIQENRVDVLPLARDMVRLINAIISDLRSGVVSRVEARERLVEPIMELKANGGMFQYVLVSEIANIVLDFLESVEEIDDDALDIIVVHQQSLNAIIANELKGDGGQEGRALANELFDACKRYYKKHELRG